MGDGGAKKVEFIKPSNMDDLFMQSSSWSPRISGKRRLPWVMASAGILACLSMLSGVPMSGLLVVSVNLLYWPRGRYEWGWRRRQARVPGASWRHYLLTVKCSSSRILRFLRFQFATADQTVSKAKEMKKDGVRMRGNSRSTCADALGHLGIGRQGWSIWIPNQGSRYLIRTYHWST